MTIHRFDLAPGIAVECDSENFTLAALVGKVIWRLAFTTLGKEFLGEFDPTQHPDYPNWGLEYGNATVLITQPSGVQPRFGSSEAAKLQAAETKLSRGRQKIVSWWPGSENSSLKQGIKFQAASFPAADPTRSESSPDYVEPGEFRYHGERETFEIVVIHELIHAYLGLKRTFADSELDTQSLQMQEERRVVGIYEYRNEKYTENRFRALFRWPPRLDYKSLNIKQDIEMVKVFEAWCTH